MHPITYLGRVLLGRQGRDNTDRPRRRKMNDNNNHDLNLPGSLCSLESEGRGRNKRRSPGRQAPAQLPLAQVFDVLGPFTFIFFVVFNPTPASPPTS